MSNQQGGPQEMESYLLRQVADLRKRVRELEEQALNLAVNNLVVGVGDRTQINRILAGTVSLDPASIPATSTGTVDFTIVGAAPGDVLIMNRPNGLNDDLIFAGCQIVSANTARVYLYNPTGGAINDGALIWTYCFIDVT